MDSNWTAEACPRDVGRHGQSQGFEVPSEPFRGSEAVATGVLTPGQLRGGRFQRIFRDVYVPAALPLTHEVRCQGVALVLPAEAVITGRSAATHEVCRWRGPPRHLIHTVRAALSATMATSIPLAQ